MGEEEVLSATLKKQDDKASLVFPDGQELVVSKALPYPHGAELSVVLTTQAAYSADKIEVAKQLLQEILNGAR